MSQPIADVCFELEQSTTNVEQLQADYLNAVANRKDLIAQALAAGIKQTDIARLTGLTRARISQLK